MRTIALCTIAASMVVGADVVDMCSAYPQCKIAGPNNTALWCCSDPSGCCPGVDCCGPTASNSSTTSTPSTTSSSSGTTSSTTTKTPSNSGSSPITTTPSPQSSDTSLISISVGACFVAMTALQFF